MARKDLLHVNETVPFKNWMSRLGWVDLPLNGPYEAIRMLHGQDPKHPFIAYKKKSGEYLSFADEFAQTVLTFIHETEKPLIDPASKNIINQFRNEYAFLSNFYDCPVKYLGIVYQNNEAAFQAQKTMNDEEKKGFSRMNAGEAKRAGRRVLLRSDWENIKNYVMYAICLCKFLQSKDLMDKLIETGDRLLVEGNDWNDTYWGIDLHSQKGKNMLGKILMNVRSQYKMIC